MPTQRRVVAERFFDEAGGMQLVLHAPFGGRINRAWGLALRKRFCRTFDFELQAAATDDGIVLSLGPQHSFPLEAVFEHAATRAGVEELLDPGRAAGADVQTRWRWNATRSLALLRCAERPARCRRTLQRMRADDLLAAVFPEQRGCQDNHGGGATSSCPITRWCARRCATASTRRWTSRACATCSTALARGEIAVRRARHARAVAVRRTRS